MPINAKDRFAELPPEEQAAIHKRADELYAEEMARRGRKGHSVTTKRQVALHIPPDLTLSPRRPKADAGAGKKSPPASTPRANKKSPR